MIMHALLLFCSIVVCVLLCLLLVCSIDLLLQLLLLCIARASGMPCSSVRLQGFIVHGKKQMHKWHRIAIAAIEVSRLSRQQNKLTPPGCESTEAAVLTVARLKVSKWKVLRWIVSLG